MDAVAVARQRFFKATNKNRLIGYFSCFWPYFLLDKKEIELTQNCCDEAWRIFRKKNTFDRYVKTLNLQ